MWGDGDGEPLPEALPRGGLARSRGDRITGGHRTKAQSLEAWDSQPRPEGKSALTRHSAGSRLRRVVPQPRAVGEPGLGGSETQASDRHPARPPSAWLPLSGLRGAGGSSCWAFP